MSLYHVRYVNLAHITVGVEAANAEEARRLSNEKARVFLIGLEDGEEVQLYTEVPLTGPDTVEKVGE